MPCARGWSPGAGRAGAAPCPAWILCRWASQTACARMVVGAAHLQPCPAPRLLNQCWWRAGLEGCRVRSGWSPGAGRAGAAPCPVWILCRWASQTTRARMVGGAASPQPVGCTHTCSCTEPCSCSCVRHRCSGRARQDGVKSWPLCANRKPGCRAIAARSVTTRQRGVHTLLHSAQPSESLAPCHTLA